MASYDYSSSKPGSPKPGIRKQGRISRIKKLFKSMRKNIAEEYTDSSMRLKPTGALSTEKAWNLSTDHENLNVQKVDEILSSSSSKNDLSMSKRTLRSYMKSYHEQSVESNDSLNYENIDVLKEQKMEARREIDKLRPEDKTSISSRIKNENEDNRNKF